MSSNRTVAMNTYAHLSQGKCFKRAILLFSFMHLFILACNAQVHIVGRVQNLNSKYLNRAVVQVYYKVNKQIAQSLVTDSTGLFTTSKLTKGKYFAKISFVGYQSADSDIFEVNVENIDLGKFILIPSDYELGEVVVEGKQKAIEQQDGKIVVNLKNSAAAGGSSGLEILERLPNINIDRQSGRISLAGKEGAIVMINGKRTYMPNEAIIQLLSGINASKIGKVEIMVNPPASLDAEGNAGVINIVMNNVEADGWNGTIEGQAGYGRGNVYNFNSDLTYTKNKLSIYAAYSIARQHQDQTSFNSRVDTDKKSFSISTISERDPIQRNHNLRVGLDYRIKENAIISMTGTYYDNRWSMNALNLSEIKLNNQLNSSLSIANTEINYWKHVGGGLNFQQKLRNNRSFSSSIDFLYYHDDNPAHYYISSLDAVGNAVSNTTTRSTKTTPISILVPQAAYVPYSNEKLNTQIGIKASISRFNNNTSAGELSNGDWSNNPALTSKANLRENILAGFGEINYKPTEKTSLKGGLRYEYTMFDLSTNTVSNNINRRYGGLFPSLSLSHQLNERNTFSAFYTRRINRPTFNDIAPFVLFIDPYTLFAGNPAIQPSYVHTIGANYALHDFIFSASYSNERNSLAKFQISVDPLNNMETIRPENLGSTNIIDLSAIAPLKINSWWTMQGSINGLRKKVQTGDFQNNRTLSLYSLQVSGSQQIKFLKNYAAEVTGFYNTATLSGTSEIQPYGGITAGIQRKIQNSIFRFNINDILNSVKSTALVRTMGYDIRNGYDFSQTTYKISYVYTFGSRQGNTPRDKNAEEERKRVQ